MNKQEQLQTIFALMKSHNYKRNNYQGITEKVYTKTYRFEYNNSKTYSISVSFDYRNIDKDKVVIHFYDNTSNEYLNLNQIPKIEEFLNISTKLMDMELDVNIQEYE